MHLSSKIRVGWTNDSISVEWQSTDPKGLFCDCLSNCLFSFVVFTKNLHVQINEWNSKNTRYQCSQYKSGYEIRMDIHNPEASHNMQELMWWIPQLFRRSDSELKSEADNSGRCFFPKDRTTACGKPEIIQMGWLLSSSRKGASSITFGIKTILSRLRRIWHSNWPESLGVFVQIQHLS